MKKAFDDNLPRHRPKLRMGSFSQPPEAASAVAEEFARAPGAAVDPSVDVHAAAEAALRSQLDPEAEPERTAPTPPAESHLDDLGAELRRRKLRSRLAALTAGAPTLAPEAPEAAQEVLGAAEAVTVELAAARERGDRLEAELARARTDLDKAAAEVERHRRDHAEAATRLDEARGLLGTLESELSAIEEERGEALLVVGALRFADAARVESLARLNDDLDHARKDLVELRSERAELLRELEAEEAQSAALNREVARLSAEKGRLATELSEAARTRGALVESRKALEEVHRVLAVARSPRR